MSREMGQPNNVLDYAELFCDELYRRRCPPMTRTDLRSFYISLKSDFRSYVWPTFENLIHTVESSSPAVSSGVTSRDHYVCSVCCHVFYSLQSFHSGHLSSSEHVSQAQIICNSAAQQSSANESSTSSFTCTLKGCVQRFRTEGELLEHIRDRPHYLFFVDRAHGLSSYACSQCAALFHSKRSLLAHTTSCQPDPTDQEQPRELKLTCSRDVMGLTETASGFEVVQIKSAGGLKLTFKARNVTSEDVLISNLEFLSAAALPIFVMEQASCPPDDGAALRAGQEWTIELTTTSHQRYDYGFYDGSLHAIVTKQGSGETSVLDWSITLVIVSEDHEDLKPAGPYRKVAPKPEKKVSCVVEGVPPFRDISNRLQQEIPLREYSIPQELRYQPQHSTVSALVSQPLTISTYEAKMHGLLHVEELAIEKSLQTYTIEDATVKEEQSYFILEVPGLAEQRPKLILGAKVKLIPNSGSSQHLPVAHVGYVYEIVDTAVHLRFDGRFKRNYVGGMSFVVEFPIHRMNLQLFHRATEMAAANEALMTTTVFPEEGRSPASSTVDSSTIRLDHLRNRLIEDNPQQQKAIKAILAGSSCPHPYIIFGPPGTGKTTTIVESIKQVYFCQGQSRILVCTPQNNAADLVAQKLLEHIPAESLIRLNSVHRKKSDVLFQTVANVSNYDAEGKVFFPSKSELHSKRVIICTLTTCGRIVSADIGDDFFTHIFVDESGQAIEPETLIPIAGLLQPKRGNNDRGNLLVLAGDPKQLGPVLRSEAAKLNGLGLSFMERLMSTCALYAKRESLGCQLDDRFVTKLLKNFRSHPAILEVPNRLFYDLELEACADVRDRERLCNCTELTKRGFPIIMHDVRGRDSRENNDPSFFNASEIETVVEYVDKLLGLRSPKVRPEDIGIISPYKQQVRKITQLLRKRYLASNLQLAIEKVKVGSVEEFQGQERMAIIISTVRAEKSIGFVGDMKRFNVAVTRAKALLIIVGNLSLLSSSSSWNSLIEYCKEHDAVRSH